jgi:hypothetical protein
MNSPSVMRDAFSSADTMQRMAAMRDVSQDLMTSLPRFLGCNGANLAQYHSTIAPEARSTFECRSAVPLNMNPGSLQSEISNGLS